MRAGEVGGLLGAQRQPLDGGLRGADGLRRLTYLIRQRAQLFGVDRALLGAGAERGQFLAQVAEQRACAVVA